MTMEDLKSLLELYQSRRNDETDMIKYAKHIHVAGNGKEIDCCKKCGHDIRHPIHLRQAESEDK